MKKIIIFTSLSVLFSCGKQIEEVIIEKKIEKIVEIEPQAKTKHNIAYYFKEELPILTNKKENQSFISIDCQADDIFIGIETTEGSAKTYSLQKLDVQTGALTEVIANLKEIKDVAISDQHIFITQANTVQVFNRQNYMPYMVIGSGTEGYHNNGMFSAFALLPSENHLLVRDGRRLLFYANADISPEKSKKISASVKSAFSAKNNTSLAQINKNIYLADNKSIEIYNLNDAMAINNEQGPSAKINFDKNILQLATFRGHLYAGLGEFGFARVNLEKREFTDKVTHYQSNPLNVQSFAFSENTLFVISKASASITTYQIKDVIYREY
ncbi:hypothetical protein [Capnocytophaga sp.]|uniref:hypothetical protein n=1 Tax=Capnocytophaga sp. TaxID=44737 RepID=UPI0026DCD4FE|nr:hypothetical protein [Capnocytophaga sp.]MDO5104537.1 hypothetical protein [Capnocytophaga sp.]